MSRIKQVTPATESEALAIRTHINVDWLRMLQGEVAGDIIFESQRFLKDIATGTYFASDGSAQEPSMTHSIADAMAFAITLPESTNVITGQHVMAFIKAYYGTRYDERFAAENAPAEPTNPEVP